MRLNELKKVSVARSNTIRELNRQIVLNYVLPEALHQGIGKAMLKALEAQAIASGIDHIRVLSSIPARTFYERNGYVSNGAPRHVGRILGDFPLIKRMPRKHRP